MNAPWYESLRFVEVRRAEWTDDMHVIAAEQTANGVDWTTTRIHMRLAL